MNSRIARTFLVAAAALLGLALIGVIVVLEAFAPPAPVKPVADAFTIEDVTIINPGGAHEVHQTLRVRDGHVVAPGARSGPDLRRYRGMYVLPGLVDMHGHMPPANPLQLTSYFQLLNLAHGVTSVRDAADIDGTSLAALRAAEEAAGYPGPRDFPCGPFRIGRSRQSAPHTYLTDRMAFVLSGTWWVDSAPDYRPDRCQPISAGAFIQRAARANKPSDHRFFQGRKILC